MKQLRRRRLQRLQRLRRLWRCKQLVKISSTKKRKDGHFIRVDPRKVVTKLREEDCVSCVSHGRSFSRSDFEESDKLEKKVWCNDTAVIWRYAHLMKISLRFLVYVEKASLSEIRKTFFRERDSPRRETFQVRLCLLWQELEWNRKNLCWRFLLTDKLLQKCSWDCVVFCFQERWCLFFETSSLVLYLRFALCCPTLRVLTLPLTTCKGYLKHKGYLKCVLFILSLSSLIDNSWHVFKGQYCKDSIFLLLQQTLFSSVLVERTSLWQTTNIIGNTMFAEKKFFKFFGFLSVLFRLICIFKKKTFSMLSFCFACSFLEWECKECTL